MAEAHGQSGHHYTGAEEENGVGTVSGRCNPWGEGKSHLDRRCREQRCKDVEIARSILVAVRQSHVRGLEFEKWDQSKHGAEHGSWAAFYMSQLWMWV